jgi:lysyl-tRNA synthetase, class II
MITKPEYHEHEEFLTRSLKLGDLRKLNIDPYPAKYEPTHGSEALQEKHKDQPVGTSEEALAKSTPLVTVSGRIVLFRSMGKNTFVTIQDGEGRIQAMFNRDATALAGYTPSGDDDSLSPYKLIEKKLDLGDIIGVKGHLFRTQKGELTVLASEVTLLTKTLLPLADKHSGLADKEIRYRKRWLDLITHPEVKKTFQQRSAILKMVRDYMQEHQFIEVETPVLQSIYGGAEARPFETKLNALDQDMFLRISLEIPLKKLIVGGMDRVFEMGKVFRNEGIDRNHNPEFTLMEAYAAYWDYQDMMRFVENLFERLALALYGKTEIPVYSHEKGESVMIELKAPWKRMSMKEALLTYANIDADKLSDVQLRAHLQKSGKADPAKLPNLTRGLLIAALFEVEAEHHLTQPHHIIDHPIETTPLCKLHRDPVLRQKGIVERFESFILASEICNSYSELNDPELQRELLEKQADRRESGDEEASPLDEEFIEAICQGMPPTGGVGIGIDRLVMIFTNTSSIRDVLYFPWMKPLEKEALK